MVAYFSDLTKEQLIKLFCKCPQLRFELCSVILNYKNLGINPKLFGVIKVNKRPGSIRGGMSDSGSLLSFSTLFNKEFDDTVHLPAGKNSVYLHNICFHSIPTTIVVQISAELYITVDEVVKNNDYDDDDSDEVEDEEKDEYEYSNDNYDEILNDCGDHFDFDCMGDWVTEGEYADEEEEEEEEEDDKITTEVEVELEDIKKNVFQVCNIFRVIDFVDYLAQKPDGGPNYSLLIGPGGYLQLNYVAFKYAVDASLELELVLTTSSEETKIVGSIMASYGKDFDYGLDPYVKRICKAILFDTKTTTNDDEVPVKPGKINLLRSALAVPANFSLIIDVNLRDLASGEEILKKPCEFLVPYDGSTSVGYIEGIDCSLKLKVDWKLPFENI